MTKYFNSSSVQIITLIAIGRSSLGKGISQVLITNYDSSDNCEVQLYIEKADATKRYLYNTVIPKETSLILDNKKTLQFDSTKYALKLRTFSDADLSIIIT
jgi:hypothetical protein